LSGTIVSWAYCAIEGKDTGFGGYRWLTRIISEIVGRPAAGGIGSLVASHACADYYDKPKVY
jgi:hypothetical protein